MRSRLPGSLCGVALLAALVACSEPQAPTASAEKGQEAAGPGVDAARILQADATPGEWLTHGRTYGGNCGRTYGAADQAGADCYAYGYASAHEQTDCRADEHATANCFANTLTYAYGGC